MHAISRVAVAITALATPTLLLTGCGGTTSTASGGGAARTIEVTMTDNAYQPAQLQVARGETVTLRFKNAGTVTHEAILGDEAAQREHQTEMTPSTGATTGTMGDADMGNGTMGKDDMGHDDMGDDNAGHDDTGHGGGTAPSSGSITVEPGRTGELRHTFDEAGPLLIGCHEPGHWEAGMKATVTIS